MIPLQKLFNAPSSTSGVHKSDIVLTQPRSKPRTESPPPPLRLRTPITLPTINPYFKSSSDFPHPLGSHPSSPEGLRKSVFSESSGLRPSHLFSKNRPQWLPTTAQSQPEKTYSDPSVFETVDLWNLGDDQRNSDNYSSFSGNPHSGPPGNVAPTRQDFTSFRSPSDYGSSSERPSSPAISQPIPISSTRSVNIPPMLPSRPLSPDQYQKSRTKLPLWLYCVMAVLGITALAALGMGIAAFAQVQSFAKSTAVATPSSTPTPSPTSWRSSSSFVTLTSSIGTGTSVIPATSASSSDVKTVDATTTRYSTLTLPMTVLLRPPSSSPTSSPESRHLHDEREQALVLPPAPLLPTMTTTSRQTTTITQTIYHLTARTTATSSPSPHLTSITPRTYTNISRRRFHAPFSWASIKQRLRSLSYDPATHLSPSQIEDTINQNSRRDTVSETLVAVASSNAALGRASPLWDIAGARARPSTTVTAVHRREEQQAQSTSQVQGQSMGSITYWDAYAQLRLQAVQLCYLATTYTQDNLHHTPEDDAFAKTVTDSLCSALETTSPPIAQGAKCALSEVWLALETEVQELCNMVRLGKIVVQSVELLCSVREGLRGRVDDCGSGATLGGYNGTMVRTATGVKNATAMSGMSTVVVSSRAGNWTAAPVVGDIQTQDAYPSLPPLTRPSAPTPPPQRSQPPPIATPEPAPPAPGPMPSHYRLTPPASWSTIPMHTFATLAPYEASFLPPSAPTAPPSYAGPHRSKSWGDDLPWPIPTGYVAPNIVPLAQQVGDLTYFNPGIGGCEMPEMKENEFAVAISWVIFDLGRDIGGSPFEHGWGGVVEGGVTKKGSVLCNRRIKAWMSDGVGGRSVESRFVVRDRCTGCRPQDIDIQPEVFWKLWNKEEAGRVQVTWEWEEEKPTGVPRM